MRRNRRPARVAARHWRSECLALRYARKRSTSANCWSGRSAGTNRIEGDMAQCDDQLSGRATSARSPSGASWR